MDRPIQPTFTEEEVNRILVLIENEPYCNATDQTIENKLIAAVEVAKRPRFAGITRRPGLITEAQ